MIELTNKEVLRLLDDIDNALIGQIAALEQVQNCPEAQGAIDTYKRRRAALASAVEAVRRMMGGGDL